MLLRDQEFGRDGQTISDRSFIIGEYRIEERLFPKRILRISQDG